MIPCNHPSRVSGCEYCEDQQLESQVKALHTPAPTGTLAQLILKARGLGILKPVAGYAGN